jgi:phage repressor protein C with HTH and peptisase S24 domain
MRIQHADIWRAIDKLAEARGLSPSGLAKRAGLDATAFNQSKRTNNGRPRWPTTESLAKILSASEGTIGEFISYLFENPAWGVAKPIPFTTLERLRGGAMFDKDGYPEVGKWDWVHSLLLPDTTAFALEITGEECMPSYRDGDMVLISPKAAIRRGSRVLLKTTSSRYLIREIERQTPHRIEMRALAPDAELEEMPAVELDWMSRIVWLSQ